MTELRELLAKFIHDDLWAHWEKYKATKELGRTYVAGGGEAKEMHVHYLRDDYDRWKRQMNTLYEDLPEEEKKSDRELADKLIKLMDTYFEELDGV